MKDFTNQPKSNYTINTITKTIREQIEDILKDLPPSVKLRELEKLAMKIRKENSVRINKEVETTKRKYPKK